MRFGAIDLGTNSVRLLVAEAGENGLDRLVEELRVPRLGAKLDQTGILQQEAIERTIAVLVDYKKIIADYNAQPIIVATSAVREAANRQEFLRAVQDQVGEQIKVVSGTQEARLTYLGITAEADDLASDVLALDIGGGSTEFMLGAKDQLQDYQSTDLGAVRLTEAYDNNLKQIRHQVQTKLQAVPDLASYSQLVGVGGTITTLAAINHSLESYDRDIIQGTRLSQSNIKEILTKLKNLSLEGRKEVRGLTADRADIILAGIVILLAVLDETSSLQVMVSDAGILEGIIYDKISI
ncbi:Ppx/GppA phosphatase family protein [Halanaerobaculum tunisiense]